MRGLSPWEGGDGVARRNRGIQESPTKVAGEICLHRAAEEDEG